MFSDFEQQEYEEQRRLYNPAAVMQELSAVLDVDELDVLSVVQERMEIKEEALKVLRGAVEGDLVELQDAVLRAIELLK